MIGPWFWSLAYAVVGLVTGVVIVEWDHHRYYAGARDFKLDADAAAKLIVLCVLVWPLAWCVALGLALRAVGEALREAW